MNKLAVVTGAASGLGLEFSTLLSKDAYDLILVDIDGTRLKEAAELLQKEYKISIRTIESDLGKKDAARKLYEQIGPNTPDILINNAGFGLRGGFVSTDWKMEESMIFLHVYTSTLLTKLVLQDMMKRRSGKIMNISSLSAVVPGPFMAIYYATKGYLMSFGRAVASEIKGSGISLTTVCPGNTHTNFSETVRAISNGGVFKTGFFTDSCENVARTSYRAMHKGKSFIIPGIKSRFLNAMAWLLPESVAISTVREKQLSAIIDHPEIHRID